MQGQILQWLEVRTNPLLARVRKLRLCRVTSSSHEFTALNYEETSTGVSEVERYNTALCAGSSGAADALVTDMRMESSQLNSSQMCVLDMFIGQQEIVMPSAAWSRQDVVEGAPSICFIQLKKA